MKSLKVIVSSLFHRNREQLTQEEPHSDKFLRRRRFFMVMPLLVLPFLTLMFWALGGGAVNHPGNQSLAANGLNLQLPDASLKPEKPLDKLGYYEKAAADSAKLLGLIRNDPYYNQQDSLLRRGMFQGQASAIGSQLNSSPDGSSAYQDPNEAQVLEKLAQLNMALNQGSTGSAISSGAEPSAASSSNNPPPPAELERLEQLMQATQASENGDPEMQQLNGMLEKILDIQHPQRMQEKIRQSSKADKGKVFAVRMKDKETPVSLLAKGGSKSSRGDKGGKISSRRNGFYSLKEEQVPYNANPNAISAVVHETQVVVSGAAVKLRLTHEVSINGVLIPKDSFLFGTASLNGERLIIKINSIRFRNSLFPVDLSVYDLDGLPGIYIPGAITRDVARQSADRAVQDIGFSTLDPSLEVQAASAGVEVAKNLFSKKAKLVKVTVKAGYQVLLQDEKQV